jgi:hypothetical protein
VTAQVSAIALASGRGGSRACAWCELTIAGRYHALGQLCDQALTLASMPNSPVGFTISTMIIRTKA